MLLSLSLHCVYTRKRAGYSGEIDERAAEVWTLTARPLAGFTRASTRAALGARSTFLRREWSVENADCREFAVGFFFSHNRGRMETF